MKKNLKPLILHNYVDSSKFEKGIRQAQREANELVAKLFCLPVQILNDMMTQRPTRRGR